MKLNLLLCFLFSILFLKHSFFYSIHLLFLLYDLDTYKHVEMKVAYTFLVNFSSKLPVKLQCPPGYQPHPEILTSPLLT